MTSHEISGALAVLWFAALCFGLPCAIGYAVETIEVAVAKQRRKEDTP